MNFSIYKKVLGVLFILVGSISFAQQANVYPKHWWVGMQTNSIQLMIHADNIGSYGQVKTAYPGIKINNTKKAESPNYYFVDITIAATTKPGICPLVFTGNNQPPLTISFPLKARQPGRSKVFAQGVTSKDFVYLLMPDRFANGDRSNDVIKEYRDTICDRKNPSAHHGGDIQGVINKIPYLKDLGVTSVWMCPVTENDMPWQNESAGAISGYHGYWITNHYEIDKRYGGNAAFKKLSDELHRNGMKIVHDAVYNHFGIDHFLYRDQPFADMFNQWKTYTGSVHREETLLSAYASDANKKAMLDGWFTPHLPDVNQRNAYMANFLIYNVLWCTEEFGIDGWRIDTYKYCDEAFLNKVNDALLKEYPTLTVFGEAWANTTVGSAYFAQNNMNTAFKHNLQGVTDFPMQSAMVSAVNQPFGWMEGVNKLYNVLAQDILYKDPKRNCIFLDNHDMDRFMTMVGGDIGKYKMATALLFTLRGIPQLYYGTEILMKNDDVKGDGKKRNDFPGGFANDLQNKFESNGRSSEENDAFNYLKALANFRKSSNALTLGNTRDYLPVNGLYVYFRQHNNETVMCVINTSPEEKKLSGTNYAETKNYTSAKDITSGIDLALGSEWRIPATTMWVLSLK